MRLRLPANNPWAVRRLKAPENVEVNVKMASPPNIVPPAVRLALPPNHVAATVKMVNPPSRAAVIAKKANPPKHVMVIGESPPNKMVEAVRARSHGLIPRSNGADGAMGSPAQKGFLAHDQSGPCNVREFSRFLFSRPAPSPQSVGGEGVGGAARGGNPQNFLIRNREGLIFFPQRTFTFFCGRLFLPLQCVVSQPHAFWGEFGGKGRALNLRAKKTMSPGATRDAKD